MPSPGSSDSHVPSSHSRAVTAEFRGTEGKQIHSNNMNVHIVNRLNDPLQI